MIIHILRWADSNSDNISQRKAYSRMEDALAHARKLRSSNTKGVFINEDEYAIGTFEIKTKGELINLINAL